MKSRRSLFDSDGMFANFRPLAADCFRENLLYRSASPCDNQHNRAPYVDALIRDAGVRCVLNLADTDEKIRGYMEKENFDLPYFVSLCEEGCVDPIALNMNFGSEEFRGKVSAGLTAMAEHDGPYLIHCTEGKDRTGFVCMLLEALCGAGYEEIRDDYMITYGNYYGITPEKDPARYATIVDSVLNPMIRSMAGDDALDLQTADLSAYAEQFLLTGGMDRAAIDRLRERIGK